MVFIEYYGACVFADTLLKALSIIMLSYVPPGEI